jgi:Fur family ferric uptake transcriptional regulator
MEKAIQHFNDFCIKQGLKNSKQRDKVVNTFLRTERHIGSFELYDIIRRKDKKIGYSTVYRTLKLLVEAGIAQTVSYGEEVHFEHKLGHKHHDHFICDKCGATIEFSNPTIEHMQEKLAKKHNFSAREHSLIIYGTCKKCSK